MRRAARLLEIRSKINRLVDDEYYGDEYHVSASLRNIFSRQDICFKK